MATETPGEKVPEPPKGGDEKKSMMVIIGGVLTRVRFPDGLKEILASDTDEKSDVVLEMGKNQKYNIRGYSFFGTPTAIPLRSRHKM